MKISAYLLGLALIAAPAAAQDIPAVRLAPGEAVTFRFDDGGRVGAPVRGEAVWSRFDIVAARHVAGMTPPDEPATETFAIPETDGVRPDPIPPHEVRMRVLSVAGLHTMLVIENGEGQALTYRARMTVKGETHSTDVCVVLPHAASREHWPYPIERLELSNFRFIPWAPGRAPTCE